MEQDNRNAYSLDHPIFQIGNIGGMQCLTTTEVVGNESYEMDLQAQIRLSPLRRPLTMDADVRVFAVYQPHRHVLGQDWIDFAKQGVDESITFGTWDTGVNGLDCLGYSRLEGFLPKPLVALPSRTWNFYCRDKSDDASIKADDYLLTASGAESAYGIQCAHLPDTMWSMGVQEEVDASDKDVTVSGGTMSLHDLEIQKGRLKSEKVKENYGQTYEDSMESSVGSRPSTNTEEKPLLLASARVWLSGHDVNGTSADALGDYSGKSFGKFRLSFPLRHFPEHGYISVFIIVRFPSIHPSHTPYLCNHPEWTYEEVFGDPDVVARQPQLQQSESDFFKNSSDTTNLGLFPYAYWYRQHPPVVHRLLFDKLGFPFMKGSINTVNTSKYIRVEDYDPTFSSLTFRHWFVQGHCKLYKLSPIPDYRTSVFAGTR